MVDEYKAPATVATDEAEARRRLQNGPDGQEVRKYPISTETLFVLTAESSRILTPEEWLACKTALQDAAPDGVNISVEQVLVVAPEHVPATDTCTVYVTAQPRFEERVEA